MSLTSKRSSIVTGMPLPSSNPPHHFRRHRPPLAILMFLPLLALAVMLGGDTNLQAFSSIAGSPQDEAVSGPLIQMPLDAPQINALGHIMNRLQYKQLAKMYVSHMTLDEKLGQLFMVQSYDQYYSPALEMMVDQLHAGGVIMYAFQMQTFQQTRHDILETQQHASIPLLIATDEEGGYVERVQNIFGHHPGALEIYETGNVNLATQAGNRIAHDLQSLGINADLAPDVDVQLVDGPDQYLRTWGYTPQSVIKFGGAYLRAVQGDGDIACLKHFPGLGAATSDAHYTLPVINRTAAQIYSVELAPFKAFIQSKNKLDNPGMIMSTDLLMPAIDPQYPAELSHIFMTDILRNQLGYDGVVITDALWMTGIAEKWNLAQAGVLALNAGNDMLLGAIGPYQMMDMINGLKAALQDGTLSMARLNEAVTRIIALKMQYHIIPVIQA
ncbi:MAG TPA: glycoside hydrolase family 3 N-terminal domain-containing protein [Ktedonobacteraceae bacterium]|jgi:beta-N-acetylhexosaminidase|nr:glycoside hydrolase family 3 N-terminal domain-containing protein [Ktedonobacteraceae bacterium]